MNRTSIKLTVAAIIVLCVCTMAVSGTVITAESGTIPAPGNAAEFAIVADSLPDGLSGFTINIALSDPSKAEITEIITPPWAGSPPGFAMMSSVPSDSVTITLLDVYSNAEGSLSNVDLIILRIRGDVVGSTGLVIPSIDIQDEDGFPVAATIQNGTITIGSTPPPTTGSLNIQSNPTGADVKLDGVYKGTTPLVISNVSPGVHTVRIEKTGYTPWENTITVTAGVTTNVTAALTALPPPPTTGSLNIQSNPTGADVKLDGVYKGVTPLVLTTISPGLHTVRIEKMGYTPWENTVTVTAGVTTNVTAALTALPPPPTTGSLNIQSNPTGADVKLDGVYKGVTPQVISNVSPGLHTVRIEKTGYAPWENPVTVTAGMTTNVTAALTALPPPPTTGTVNVTSEPSGADVKLDGVLKGTTPLAITDVSPGTHTLRVEKTGYLPFTAPVSVTGGATTSVHAVLDPVPPVVVNGTIEVTSSPTGAGVSLDGMYRGTTPLVIPDVSNGIHTLRLESSGYIPWEEPVIVTAGETTYVHATLTTVPPATGSVTVQSDPDGANVYLDGEMKGLTPVALTGVSPGPHIVRIEKTGYLPYQKDITVIAGSTTIVSAALAPVPPPTTGSVNVQSEPDGANVYLDGVLTGITPLLISNLSPGNHVVIIELTGYETYENTSVPVMAGATTLVSTVLEPTPPPPDTGAIDITSSPADATVYLDNVLKGTTPLSIVNLVPGPYTIRIEKSGYEVWEENVTLSAGETELVEAILTPTPSPTPTPTPTSTGIGNLFVSSYPTGAKILIDEKDTGGRTNTIVKGIPVGPRQLTLEKSGYVPKTIPVTIQAGKLVTLPMITLVPGAGPTPSPTIPPTTQPTVQPTTPPTVVPTIPLPPGPASGGIMIYSMPFGCSVYIDDVYRGTTPGIYSSVAPGPHVVKLTLGGYQDSIRSVNVEAGRITTMVVVMVPDISALASAFL